MLDFNMFHTSCDLYTETRVLMSVRLVSTYNTIRVYNIIHGYQ